MAYTNSLRRDSWSIDSNNKTQLKGVSLSGLWYAVFAGDEKTLTLSEKGSRRRDLQDSIVSLYRIT